MVHVGPVAISESGMNNPLSHSSVKIDLFDENDVHLRQASGFVLEDSDRYYLITDRHVVGGADAQNSATVAHFLKTTVHVRLGQDERQRGDARRRIIVHLRDDDGVPTWIERQVDEHHPEMVDVIAVLLDLGLSYESILSKELTGRDIWVKLSAIPISAIDTDTAYAPPDTVHIIGYPHNWAPCGADQYCAAFWRTSTIASEIDEIGRMHLDAFFVDPPAPEGMTGSPIIGMKDDRVKLLGVYSDISTTEFGANAGLVWGASLVKRLLNA
jgi:hypothetical protein